VQPPIEVLEHMVTFRVHLDSADESNGCLRVIPESHKGGILTQTEVTEAIKSNAQFLCRVKEGDLVIMKPLILHSSAKATTPKHRRVVHVEYSSYKLPGSLKWA
jgi:ectoine hydroxylase-related dioxygenase (phytanoyl-CoA dioxygenase family)